MNAEAQQIDRARGMVDLPLSDTGEEQADHLGRRIAAKGGVDTIVTSALHRAQQTTAAVLRHNRNAHLEQVTDGLDPWHQGSLEGRPVEEVEDELKYYAEHPDQKIPGVGVSGVPGESVNDHARRVGHAIRRLLAGLKPGERKLVLAHHSTIRFLHGWAKKGFPPDMSSDPMQMVSKEDKAAPADGLFRLAKKDGKPFLDPNDLESDEPMKPGLSFARHGETIWNKPSGHHSVLRRLSMNRGNKGPTLS